MFFKKKIFKSDEQKLAELNERLIALREANKDNINSYCMIGSYVFIFKGFSIDTQKKEIIIKIIDENTPKDMVNLIPLWLHDMKYGESFHNARMNWIVFKDKLSRMGLEMKLKIS